MNIDSGFGEKMRFSAKFVQVLNMDKFIFHDGRVNVLSWYTWRAMMDFWKMGLEGNNASQKV